VLLPEAEALGKEGPRVAAVASREGRVGEVVPLHNIFKQVKKKLLLSKILTTSLNSIIS
jgi:hypothetical protein